MSDVGEAAKVVTRRRMELASAIGRVQSQTRKTMYQTDALHANALDSALALADAKRDKQESYRYLQEALQQYWDLGGRNIVILRRFDWRSEAYCMLTNRNRNSHDPNFFPEVGNKADMQGRAKGKCFSCNVRTECLDWAFEVEGLAADQHHRYGIYGAMNPAERTAEGRNRIAEKENDQ